MLSFPRFCVMILGCGLVPVVLGQGWRDDFSGPTLDPRWEWYVPRPGPTLDLTVHPGWLRLTVPQTSQGFNHWTNEQHAAFLRTTALPGDWDLEARVDLANWKPDSNFHLALVVGFSDAFVLAWGPFLSRRLYPQWKEPGLWCEPTGSGAYIQLRVPPKNVQLRIAKRVDTYTCSYRPAGTNRWMVAGSFYGGGLVPRFVGIMGKSFGANPAGALDVDYMALTPFSPPSPPPPLHAEVRISMKKGRRLPPFQRGAFVEMLGNCVFKGIWDERLTNRKFNGTASPSGVLWGWEPYGKARKWQADRTVFLAEPQSQRIDLSTDTAGILQSGLAFPKNRSWRVRAVVRARGDIKPLRIALAADDGKRELAFREFPLEQARKGWQVCSAELVCKAGAADGVLRISASGPGTLWLGAVSLMPADTVDGFRRDLLDITRLAPPTMIRWPGGNMASGYHWRDGVGDPDRRPMRWDRAWNAWVYNDMGTDEFIRYCRLLGAEPCICVNAGEGTAEEAARWVEYCNGGTDTAMGRLRAAHGHPEPYNVRWWDVGNEIWGPWQLGHVGPEIYGLRAVEFARAMRRVSPEIKLVASGVLRGNYGDWNRKMLPICGSFMDLLSVHDYVDYDVRRVTDTAWEKVVGAPVRIEAALRETAQLARRAAGKPLPLAFDEWNSIPHPPNVRGGQGLPDAVYAAGILHAMHRCGPDAPVGNYALLVNPIGALRTTQTQVIQTPVFLVFRLFARHTGDFDIPVQVTSPRLGNVPAVDVAASLTRDGKTLHLTAINRHPRRPITVRWQLPAGVRVRAVKSSQVSGPEPWARNTPEAPETVVLRTRTLPWPAGAEPEQDLPPASVTGLSIGLNPNP